MCAFCQKPCPIEVPGSAILRINDHDRHFLPLRAKDFIQPGDPDVALSHRRHTGRRREILPILYKMLLRPAQEFHRIVWPEVLDETHQEILRHLGGDEVRHRKLCLFPREDLCPRIGKWLLLLKKIRIHRKHDGIHPKTCPIRLFILEKIQRRICTRG
ncbi:Uncharacterised protein [Bacteroides xylanisolvens]|nr:Uncharacterised protein [Bacteroides xylanisolvens]